MFFASRQQILLVLNVHFDMFPADAQPLSAQLLVYFQLFEKNYLKCSMSLIWSVLHALWEFFTSVCVSKVKTMLQLSNVFEYVVLVPSTAIRKKTGLY